MLTIEAEVAREMILADSFPLEPTHVKGDLDLSNQINLTHLPDSLRGARELNLRGCSKLTHLPTNLETAALFLDDCIQLKTLPNGLKTHLLQAQRAGLETLPDDLQVPFKLDLTDCKSLVRLPTGLKVGSLIVSGCSALETMPNNVHIFFLDAANCTHLQTWGEIGIIFATINLSGCRRLTYLPNWMTRIGQLDITDCENLHELPANLTVVSHIELANSGLTALPVGCKNTELHWHDVLINERIAFHPETLSAQEILKETNIERRRVMLERVGYETFFRQVDAELLDRDVDPGGVRRLLRVEFKDTNRWQKDEPIVCLSVICPSTARSYIIRVPPQMKSCRQAAAWVAGFDDPAQYQPLIET